MTKKREGDAPRYCLTAKGEDAVYILLAILRFGIRHYMKKKKLDEAVIKELHYKLPSDEKWLY